MSWAMLCRSWVGAAGCRVELLRAIHHQDVDVPLWSVITAVIQPGVFRHLVPGHRFWKSLWTSPMCSTLAGFWLPSWRGCAAGLDQLLDQCHLMGYCFGHPGDSGPAGR